MRAGLAGLCLLLAAPVWAADVGVSIGISQPGMYGRIDIGRFPQPVVVVQQPVLVAPPRVVHVRPQPVYLWVPPGHRKHWSKHCAAYGACGVPVYFVQDRWYHDHVMDDRRGDARRGGSGHGKDKHKDKDKDKGPGKGKGHDRD